VQDYFVINKPVTENIANVVVKASGLVTKLSVVKKIVHISEIPSVTFEDFWTQVADVCSIFIRCQLVFEHPV